MSESIRAGLGRDDLDRQSLAVFAFLWAVFAVMEQAKWDKWASSPPDIAFSFTAWWLLFRPKSLLPFALLPAIHLWGLSERLPWIPNHTTLAAIVDVTILLALGRVALKRRRPFDRARVFREFAPVLRLSVLVLYFWAFFHKLNVDWLDPQWSCATSMYLSWTRAVPLLPTADWARQVSVYPTLAIEIAIPLLLISRRTRWLGIVVTAGFHFTLGLSAFYRHI